MEKEKTGRDEIIIRYFFPLNLLGNAGLKFLDIIVAFTLFHFILIYR